MYLSPLLRSSRRRSAFVLLNLVTAIIVQQASRDSHGLPTQKLTPPGWWGWKIRVQGPHGIKFRTKKSLLLLYQFCLGCAYEQMSDGWLFSHIFSKGSQQAGGASHTSLGLHRFQLTGGCWVCLKIYSSKFFSNIYGYIRLKLKQWETKCSFVKFCVTLRMMGGFQWRVEVPCSFPWCI